MFEGAFSPMHWLLVLAIALIFFGPKKLPEIGRGLGSAIRGFKDALAEGATAREAPSRPSEQRPVEGSDTPTLRS